MNKRAKEFYTMMAQLIHEGWRAYIVEDIHQLEERAGILHLTNREILYYENTPVFFVRDKYHKEQR